MFVCIPRVQPDANAAVRIVEPPANPLVIGIDQIDLLADLRSRSRFDNRGYEDPWMATRESVFAIGFENDLPEWRH